ncbi:MAG: hypothetical protein IPP71_05885 [Bacteroidetes bacterium]|nr:hypothetical protein [Bacteroidota bacterium]
MLITLHFYFIDWLFYLAMILLIFDAIEESIMVLLIPEWENDIKGIYWLWKRKR